jgi:hypothetical protein
MKTTYLFRPDDLQDLAARGITVETVLSQIETFTKGLPCIPLQRSCTVGDGITVLSSAELDRYGVSHARAAALGRFMKFVPASGAASRMFEFFLSAAERTAALSEEQIAAAAQAGDREYQAVQQFVSNLKLFAFFEDLRSVMATDGFAIEDLISKQHCKAILQYLLTAKGLNYANLPKAMLKFHRYPDHVRTAVEEHLVEALAYTQDRQGVVQIHFTVSPEHLSVLQSYLDSVRSRYEQDGRRFVVTFSVQKPSTDTIAVDPENAPFRANGKLVFRPGGHGALLVNLHDLRGDVVFIKNIDNVTPDRLKAETYRYKRALGGYLIELQDQIFRYLHSLGQKLPAERAVTEVAEFLRRELYMTLPDRFLRASLEEQRTFLIDKMNRPLRVCGVVKNTGEPGGGPFWVAHADGEVSAQIVEASQVDLQSPSQRKIWASASHFNPVDLVCGVRDYLGRPFDLTRFVDYETGFIARKSKDGRELKALELPGLWNGAMSKWNTVFVEVPLATFTPVKTVLDLLRPEHQSV